MPKANKDAVRPAVFVGKECPKKHRKAMEKMAAVYERYLDVFCLPAGTQIYLKYWATKKWRQRTDFERAEYDRFTIEVSRKSLYASAADMRSTVRHEISHIIASPLTMLAANLVSEKYKQALQDAEETVVTRIERTMQVMDGDAGHGNMAYEYDAYLRFRNGKVKWR